MSLCVVSTESDDMAFMIALNTGFVANPLVSIHCIHCHLTASKRC